MKAYGALGLTVECGFYDSLTIDGHVVELGTGTGGRESEQCRIGPIDFVSVKPGGSGVVGVVGSDKTGTFSYLSGLVTAVVATHGFETGQRVYVKLIAGGQPERVTVTRIDPNTFTFAPSASPSASGNITVQIAAMTVMFGANDANHIIDRVGGNVASKVEVDLNRRGVLVVGDHEKVLFVRASARLATLIRGGGAEASVETPTLLTSTIAERTVGAGVIVVSPLSVKILGISRGVCPPRGAGQTKQSRSEAEPPRCSARRFEAELRCCGGLSVRRS